MNTLLKNKKVEVARSKGNSKLIFCSPSSRLCRNYMALFPQLDVSRGMTLNVQQKSEAKYIAERSLRNAISYILSVAVSHYMREPQDNRLSNIDLAIDVAKRIYDLISKENDGQ